jgi:23S rRNA (cytosine1962-C5)-methyltransferase
VARPLAELVLAPGRDKSLRQRHPWVFSGAIASVEGAPKSGETVSIVAANGDWLAHAAYSPASQIRARVWSFDREEAIDARFFERRVERAHAARAALVDDAHTARRLIHGEADGLPGIVADQYADVVVLQLASAGGERWRDEIASALRNAVGAKAIYERSDAEVRALEGLPPRTGLVSGALPQRIEIREDSLAYRVDVARGQKTGFYLDQRDNRALVRSLARGRRVLNAFAYTGGFGLAALAGGAASVLSIESSAEALAVARENMAQNPALDATRAEWREGDVFVELRTLRNAAAQFDLIVVDPPKLAPTASHVAKAARAYKDVNLLALKLLAPGGLLATFSCSGSVSAELFQKIVAGAAIDAKADAAIIGRMSASADHPVALAFPEGDYLKGLLVEKRG